MSEPEFDLYLSLMSKFLRLNAEQKSDIAEELRVHLEDRLAELMAQGKSRDDAIRLALDEFGDAGALAWQFTLPHSLRRRRQIMRYSIGSFAALAGIFTLVTLTWPSRPDQPPAVQMVVAQAERSPTAAGLQQPTQDTTEMSEDRKAIDEQLASRKFGYDLVSLHLNDAIGFLSQLTSLPIIYASGTFNEDEYPNLITLQVDEGKLSVRTALELILRQSGGDQLTYSIKDGVILISNSNEDYEVQVYDCRDLLAGVQVHGANQGGGMMGGIGGGMGGGGGFFSVPAELAVTVMAQGGFGADEEDGPAGLGGRGGRKAGASGVRPAGGAALAGPAKGAKHGGMGGGFAVNPMSVATSPAGAALIGVLQSATQPAQWINTDGDGGSMSEFDGVIVVRHHQAVHRKIEDVLAKLRKVKRSTQLAVQPQLDDVEALDIPAGKRLVTMSTNNWQLPVEVKIQPGSRVDLVVVKSDGRTDGVLENLEIAWLDAYPTQIGGSTKAVMLVQQVGFIVKPEQVEELMFVKNGNAGNWYFMLRSEQEDEEDGKAVESEEEMEEKNDDPSRNNQTSKIKPGREFQRIPVEEPESTDNAKIDRRVLVSVDNDGKGLNWTVNRGSVAPGSRVDLLRKSKEGTETILSNVEVALVNDSTSVARQEPDFSNATVRTLVKLIDSGDMKINRLCLLVTPGEALRLKSALTSGPVTARLHATNPPRDRQLTERRLQMMRGRAQRNVKWGVELDAHGWEVDADSLQQGMLVDVTYQEGALPPVVFQNLKISGLSYEKASEDRWRVKGLLFYLPQEDAEIWTAAISTGRFCFSMPAEQAKPKTEVSMKVPATQFH